MNQPNKGAGKAQKPIRHFTMPPQLFNAITSYLMQQPYREVAALINGLQQECKAVFENPPGALKRGKDPVEPPAPPPGKGEAGQIVRDVEPGNDKPAGDPDAREDDAKQPAIQGCIPEPDTVGTESGDIDNPTQEGEDHGRV